VVYHCNTLEVAEMKYPKVEDELEQFFNVAVLSVPFAAWTTEPRLDLGIYMMRQALSGHVVKTSCCPARGSKAS